MKDSIDSSDTVTSLADNCSTPLALSLAVMTMEAMLSDPTRGEFSTVKIECCEKIENNLFRNNFVHTKMKNVYTLYFLPCDYIHV